MHRHDFTWQSDWALYAQIAKTLFLFLRQRASTSESPLSFLACDAVSFFCARHCSTRREGVALGQCMVQDCLISHVGIMRPFEDSPRVFRFNVSRAEDVIDRIGLTRFPQRETEHVEDSPSSSSLLAFSEASCDLMDAEIPRNDCCANTTAKEPEAIKQFPPRHIADTNFGIDAEREEETELEEPKVAYKVLSYISFDRIGAPIRKSEAGAGNSGMGGGDTKALFSNAPAFRKKLNSALLDRQEGKDRRRACDERTAKRRTKGLAFLGRVGMRKGGAEGRSVRSD